ncbi:Retinol dehydrogenase 14,Retinol dehydrogenase 11,Dehydrogenase/reductase SDR family member 13,Retinol dehydrogenase 13,Retinol dehydrogenase 12 [Mytilus coruscus]|uniref:Retinol dehydrogenase 14,Retinol dehydrogenase 11,Dehydrogenase/reductase SDR family member 13,Retinol dehydrogenase 13,Retinol dehydrogenase 12 n=1 Tax=Mytilus coruscus TaxID=42192 RepID=A0A6J8CLT0_MYTCO|nr:Retinol dehydrogenase 14,Retinol dehydrogenase 11,Dehydrogenase/reductase SDR family member 13,Retinol dehydrogenase 13,Retinol dehydrogenase 12 [Mytilus coruscus]
MEPPTWYVTASVTLVGMYVTAVLFRSLRTRRCNSTVLLHGKTCIVTGANTGIGLQTALELAKRHARVIMACRDQNKARKAIEYVKSRTENGSLVFRPLDLASHASVKEFCSGILEEEHSLNVLINNAGVMGHPYQLSEDGIEMHMAVNHFSVFLLTNLLLPKLKGNSPSRIVFVSSALHKRGEIDFENLKGKQTKGYANSKLANVYFARELHDRLADSKVDVFTVHPGMVDTELARHSVSNWLWKLLYPLKLLLIKTASQGCQTVVHCAISEELEGKSGGYFGSCVQEPWPDISSCKDTQLKIWKNSKEITGF